MGGYQWIFPHLLHIPFLVAAVSEYSLPSSTYLNLIGYLILAMLLLSHETGIHWFSIHMTMKALTIGCEHDIKQMHTAALRDPWIETL